MSILCSSDVYGRLEMLFHQTRSGELNKQQAFDKLMEIIERAEDGDMVSQTIREVFNANN